jgi:hypothetical protein
MKLSNKILVGFFGFIFIYMLAAFTELRISGTLYQIDESNRIVESVDIAKIGYIIVPDLNHQIIIKSGEQPRIEVQSITGELLKNLTYKMTGDTLELMQFDLEKNQHVNILVYVPDNSLRGISLNGSQAFIDGLNQKSLTISLTGGSIRFHDNNNLETLSLVASHNATFNYSGTKLETLSVMIDNSQISISSPVNRIEGTVANSHLYLGGVNEIEIKKDESSRLYLN